MAITYYRGQLRLDDSTTPASLLVWHGGAWISAAGPPSIVKQVVTVAQSSDNTNISSGSIADYPNLSASITLAGSTKLLVLLEGSVQGGGNMSVELFIKVSTTTVDLGNFFASGGNSTGVGGQAVFTGLAAGAYTVQPRYLTSGAGLYCRPSGNPAQEQMKLVCIEYV